MSSSALMALVGNDARKADELVIIVAELVRSCLAAMHKEEQYHDDVSPVKSPAGTSEHLSQWLC
ncbi:MAG: hypothetical protein AAGU27_25920 [Dehalobacterium sp.]